MTQDDLHAKAVDTLKKLVTTVPRQLPEIGAFFMTQNDLHAKAVETLKKLVTTVEATGGLIAYEDGTHGCAGDPDWIDLADAVLEARAVLENNGIDVPLTITAESEG